jgi:hypothetical protein
MGDAVRGKEEIVRELNRLMDEQLKMLESSLVREQAIEYAIRAARIKELVATLGRSDGNH